MDLIIFFSASCFIGFILMALFSKRMYLALPQNRVLRSLGRLTPATEKNIKKIDTKKERFHTTLHRLLHSIQPLNQGKRRSLHDFTLASAGLANWSNAEWQTVRYIFSSLCVLFSIVICNFLALDIPQIMKIAGLSFLMGLFLPIYWLKHRIRDRQQEIERSLPEILDLIMVSVEAGLGFDAALLKVTQKQTGVLSQEFGIVLQEIKMGRPRRESLKDMAQKNNVDDLSNVIASLIQADQLGISMGNVLKNQSKQIRQKRRQRAQEQAQKAPVKIMIPLVFFIFPSIFIVILGPAAIKVMNIFSK